jgi:hypothetical protein
MSYASRESDADEVVDANPTIVHRGISEVIFATSSGNALQSGEITLTNPSGRISTTTIGSYGQIIWTN